MCPVWVCWLLASRPGAEVEDHGALPPLAAGRGLHMTVVVVAAVVGDKSAGPAACGGPGVLGERGAGQRSHTHLTRAREGVAVVPHIS